MKSSEFLLYYGWLPSPTTHCLDGAWQHDAWSMVPAGYAPECYCSGNEETGEPAVVRWSDDAAKAITCQAIQMAKVVDVVPKGTEESLRLVQSMLHRRIDELVDELDAALEELAAANVRIQELEGAADDLEDAERREEELKGELAVARERISELEFDLEEAKDHLG